VTAIFPVGAPGGTTSFTCVSETTLKLAALPLTLTALAPLKCVPVTVTGVPVGPLVGVNDDTVGTMNGVTAKLLALVTVPTTPVVLVTVTRPVVADAGTVAFRVVGETKVLAAATPLNLTALPELNPVPVIVTTVFFGPLDGESFAIPSVTV